MSLSDKIWTGEICEVTGDVGILLKNDVKEFIKQLKEMMYKEFNGWTNGDGCKQVYDEIIDKLAGSAFSNG